ncbi:hypothetical protein LTR08_006127 [Meristemomyces frigidus]|nr:hypothetical protein LTR08_006127 [Meristemomyces frigidus]
MADTYAKSPMLTLPNEIFVAVAELLDTTSLFNLRLSLADIISVPRLSAALGEVKLVVLDLSSRFSDDTSSLDWPELTVSTNKQHEERESIELGRSPQRLLSKILDAWHVNAAMFSKNDEDMRLLADIFTMLASEDRSIKVALTNTNGNFCFRADIGVYGVHQLRRSLGAVASADVKILKGGSCAEAAKSVLSALTKSTLRVRDLDLCSTSISGSGLCAGDALISDLAHCFTHLTVLDIGLNEFTEKNRLDPRDEPFIKALRAAVNLESVSVKWIVDWEGSGVPPDLKNFFDLFASAISPRRLRRLSVSGMRLCEQQLVELLEAHCETLRSVSLGQIIIGSEDEWSRVLGCINDKTNLDRLELHSLLKPYPRIGSRELQELVADRPGVGLYKRGTFNFEGRDVLKTGIGELLGKARYQWWI